jgi:hypothetical protein
MSLFDLMPFSLRRTKSANARNRYHRPALDSLEDRALLSAGPDVSIDQPLIAQVSPVPQGTVTGGDGTTVDQAGSQGPVSSTTTPPELPSLSGLLTVRHAVADDL